jgi:D-alanyl-D-alanine endopeptidase (penicillin-binding protein 7)
LTARAPAVKAVARDTAGSAGFSSKTPVGAHSGSGAAAALAGAGIGASAVKASLHESAPDSAGTLSIGEAIGLHRVPDPLALRSAVALVVDPNSGEILYDKNSNAVLPIASITKVMMAMVVLDARQPLDEKIAVEDADRDTERHSASRLPVGSVLTRAELLQLALMSSENRAASALARNYPGGLDAFIAAANRKAAAIGMRDSVFMDGTGLSSSNVSTARDLAVMVARASRYPLISRYSTASELKIRTAHGMRAFRTTNRMVLGTDWDLTLQKTGYINESGNCLVMRGMVDGRALILVLLDSYGRYSRLGDAQRIRRWLEG